MISFWQLWAEAAGLVLVFMSMVWLVSVKVKNAGIVDPFWGLGFVLAATWYAWRLPLLNAYQLWLWSMVVIWGLRLFAYLFLRNFGKPEDYRYAQFRQNYGPERYWWFSFFQVFMLQGVLLAFISVTLLGALYPSEPGKLVWLMAGITLFCIGFVFESVGDWQMARFKADPQNRQKVMDKGLWRFTRHPNYFGDTMVWWGFAAVAVYNGYPLAIAGALLMTWLIVKISGVAMLERNLKTRRPGYDDYIRRTPAFFPWFPKK